MSGEAVVACEFCGHELDAAAGRYGCPNCHGEGLDDSEQFRRNPKPQKILHKSKINIAIMQSPG